MTTNVQILVATNNPHKAEEIGAILSDLPGVELLTVAQLPVQLHEPVEDGVTLEENAYIKARELHDATGLPTIADDTGLEVDALGGAPGVYSARFAGPDATYDDNWRLLLSRLDGIPPERRTARFRCVVCYVDDQRALMADGAVEGVIIDAPRGENGFGYDPVFLPREGDGTFAEMDADAKHAISHRGRALRRLHELLAPVLDAGGADA